MVIIEKAIYITVTHTGQSYDVLLNLLSYVVILFCRLEVFFPAGKLIFLLYDVFCEQEYI